MRASFQIMRLLVLGALFFPVSGKLFGQDEARVFKLMREMESAVNATCPRQLNEFMILRNTIASSTKFEFTYLRQYTDLALEDFNLKSYREAERKELGNFLRTTEETQLLGELGIAVVYADYSKDMELIAKFVFEAEDYAPRANDGNVSSLDMSLSTSPYHCDGSGKAKGLRFDLRPPNSWEELDGNRPNVVRKWEGKMPSGLPASVMILIAEKDELIASLSLDEVNALFSDGDFVEEMAEMTVQGMSQRGYPATLLYAASGKVDGEPCLITDYSFEGNSLGVKVQMYTRVYRVFTNGQMMDVQFGFPGIGELDAHKTMMFMMMNSVVFPDKWKR